MSAYEACMQKKPVCLVVKYERGETRQDDKYTWSFPQGVPHTLIVGFIVRVQAELAFRNPEKCDAGLCVLAFHPSTHKMEWFVDTSIPIGQLVGTLELVKAMLIDMQIAAIMQAQQAKMQSGIVDAAGKPLLRR